MNSKHLLALFSSIFCFFFIKSILGQRCAERTSGFSVRLILEKSENLYKKGCFAFSAVVPDRFDIFYHSWYDVRRCWLFTFSSDWRSPFLQRLPWWGHSEQMYRFVEFKFCRQTRTNSCHRLSFRSCEAGRRDRFTPRKHPEECGKCRHLDRDSRPALTYQNIPFTTPIFQSTPASSFRNPYIPSIIDRTATKYCHTRKNSYESVYFYSNVISDDSCITYLI